MSDLDLLERAQEAVGNDPLPSDLVPAESADEEWLREFAANGRDLLEISRKGTSRMEELIAGVRAHPDNDRNETFRELGPLLSARITKREGQLAQLVLIDHQARRIKDATMKKMRNSIGQVIMQLGREHRALVTLYYLLKADADDASDDTHGGMTLSNANEIDQFFDRHISAK